MTRNVDVVVVDHHDSYTGNLVHLFAEVTGSLPQVLQHDDCTLAQVLEHDFVVLSPGPGHPGDPRDFRIGRDVIRAARQPVLGVCLGMQGMVTTLGGDVERTRPGHGVDAVIRHAGTGVFAGIPDDFRAVRYHSLAAVEVPEELEVTARDAHSGLVMAVAHRSRPLAGVQFHPESILSEHGAALVSNFLEQR